MVECLSCKIPLSGRRRSFCSKSCNNKWANRNIRRQSATCSNCGNSFQQHRNPANKRETCPTCSWALATKRNQAGPANPAWKGGHQHWKPGRAGRDKNGLSWKQQRQLCWERDSYSCQKCGYYNPKRNPDCHHIVPYRVSFSHALDNLISLCKKCHKVEDQKVLSYGRASLQAVPGLGRPVTKPHCTVCRYPRRRPNPNGLCHTCQQERLRDKACEFKLQGLSNAEIGRKLGFSRISVYHWTKHLGD